MRRAASALLLSSIIAAAGCETGSGTSGYAFTTPPGALATTPPVRPVAYVPPSRPHAVPTPRPTAAAAAPVTTVRPAYSTPVLGSSAPTIVRPAPTATTTATIVRPASGVAPRPATVPPAPPPTPAPTARPAAAASMTVLATDQTFDRELSNATTPVLLTFTAKWCGPCHAAAPVLDAFGVEQAGRVKVIRIDFDQSPRVVRRYSVSALPAVLLVNNGVVVKRMVGYQSRENLAAALCAVRP